MNKKILFSLGALVALGLVAGAFLFFTKQKAPVALSGPEKHIRIVAEKNEWEFSPSAIEVKKGDRVFLEIVNEDDYEHGLAIDGYDVSQLLPANKTSNIEFVADKEGEFTFRCFIPCGDGDTPHGHRGHREMTGTFIVRS
jgi:plastocyanin